MKSEIVSIPTNCPASESQRGAARSPKKIPGEKFPSDWSYSRILLKNYLLTISNKCEKCFLDWKTRVENDNF